MKVTFKLFNSYVSKSWEELSEEKLDEVFGKFFGKEPAASQARAKVEPKLASAKEKVDAQKGERQGQQPTSPKPGQPGYSAQKPGQGGKAQPSDITKG